MNDPVRIGVVLSSGAGRGVFAHTGFMQALTRLEIDIVAIAGCSAGALVGGVYASGTDINKWAENLAHVRARDYWTPDSWIRFFWKIIAQKGRGYTGLSGTDAAIEFIRRHLTVQTFETCKIPFHSLAINLTQGTKIFFGEGELAPRIMASAAIPFLYRPVEINGEFFSDGAVIDLAPTDAICCQHNLDILLVHHTSLHREGPIGFSHALKERWSMLELLFLQLYSKRSWYLSNKPLSTHYCRCGCGALVVVLEPDLPELSWPVRRGGDNVRSSAMQQAIDLLESHKSEWKKLKKNI